MTPQLTNDQRVRIAELLPIARQGIRRRVTLRQHLLEVDPGPWLDWWHVGKMMEQVQAVLDGEIERLMINAPPRSFKSRPIVQGGTSCRLRNDVTAKIFVACASDDLVRYHSRHAKTHAIRAGVQLRPDSTAADLWETTAGGTYKAVTVAAGRLGFGWDFGVIDDPFASRADALRIIKQQAAWMFFTDDFPSRKQPRPDGKPPGMIVIQQRLAPGDLSGRVYKWLETTEQDWTVLILKGYAERTSIVLPECCTVIPDERTPGEPLATDAGLMREIDERRRTNPHLHRAVDQQDPTEEAGGGVYARSFYKIIDEMPTGATRRARGWDFSAGGTDATASCLGSCYPDTEPIAWVWEHMTETHQPPAQLQQLVLDTAHRDGKDVEVFVPDEPAMGKVIAEQIRSALQRAGFTAHLAPQRGPKRSRALQHAALAAARCAECSQLIVPAESSEMFADQGVCECEVPTGPEHGRVALLRGPWNERFLTVHHGFTGEPGGVDDIVDAAAVALNGVYDGKRRKAGHGRFDAWG